MTPDDKKKAVALAALEYVESGWVIGIGTGSTANHFIDGLAKIKGKLDGAVARSNATAERLKKVGRLVERRIVELGGQPVLRDNFKTDNGNIILDVHNLNILNPVKLEEKLDHIAGVVTNGLFARRPADVLLLASDQEIGR